LLFGDDHRDLATQVSRSGVDQHLTAAAPMYVARVFRDKRKIDLIALRILQRSSVKMQAILGNFSSG
jgi:hypothetical protein